VDGDTTALDATTDNLVGSLAVDDRVRVHLHSDGIIVTGLQGGGNRSNPNLLINGNFRINQRGVTSRTSGSGYLFDRWKRVEATQWYEWTTAPQGQPLTVGNSTYVRHLSQVIERASVPAGTYTLSWEGTATGIVHNSGGSGPSYTSGPITVALDGLEDVVVSFEGRGDTLGKVKLEAGTVPTPFVPRLYGDELALCQRYYLRQTQASGSVPVSTGALYDSSTSYHIIRHPVTMRAAPSIAVSNASDFTIYSDMSSTTPSDVSLHRNDELATQIKAEVSGLTAGNASYLRMTSTGCWLAFDAEL